MSWRAPGHADGGLIEQLASACLSEDGGHPLAAAGEAVRTRVLSAQSSLGRFTEDGQLVGYAAVSGIDHGERPRVRIIGQVHPEHRGRGFGGALLSWSVDAARGILQEASACGGTVCIATESLTADAAVLYARFGFELAFAEDVLRRDLGGPVRTDLLPDGIEVVGWTPECAGQFFQAYDAAFRDRPGFPGWSEEEWTRWTASDGELEPEFSLLALADGAPAGFVTCTRDWIVQVGVAPEWRRRGLGAALTTGALVRMQSGGAGVAWLDVNVNNPAATRLYLRLGFVQAGRRARYERQLSGEEWREGGQGS